MNKEDIVKLLMWLNECDGFDNEKEACKKIADNYISENEPKALNIDFVSFSLPTDEETEKRAEYMQRPRKEQSEEFIYGYMQGAEWIINKIKPNES